jgi:uncharacterized membrane protein YdfJ with MMPL/SSD domain
VLRRPVVSVVVSAAVLLALAAPLVGIKTVTPGPEALPRDLSSIQVFDRMQKSFPGEADPAVAVVKAPSIDEPRVKAAIADLKRRALATGRVHTPIRVRVNEQRTVARILLPIDGTGSDSASYAAIDALRSDVIPQTTGRLPKVESGITGDAAESKDFNAAMHRTAPLVFTFVLLFAFLLLLASFRSLVIAVKAIALNLLSVAAAFGVLVAVFQHSWAKGILGFDYSGGVMAWLPIFLFVILFGLSMDYHVFILSRIREAYDGGMKTEDAIAHGIKSTAGVVTSAAVVMVFVFSIFGTLSLIMM